MQLVETEQGNITASGIMFYSYTEKSKGWLWSMDSIAAGHWLCNKSAAALGIVEDTTCVNIMVESGTYLYYPDAAKCCFMCSGAQGCGTVIPGWFANGTMDGVQEFGGELCNRWFLQGFQDNFFWIKVTARSFADAVGYGTAPPLAAVVFDRKHFHFGPVPQATFNLPPECTNSPPICAGQP